MTAHEGTWLTPAALRKLEDELGHLTTTGREEIVKRIAEARSHGDLKENAEYDTAKNDQGLMEARIRQITHLIENAKIIEAVKSGVVTVGTIATVVDDDGDEMEFFVAPPRTSSPAWSWPPLIAPSAPHSWEQHPGTGSPMPHLAGRSPTPSRRSGHTNRNHVSSTHPATHRHGEPFERHAMGRLRLCLQCQIGLRDRPHTVAERLAVRPGP
jgi:transcription elongation GreA/GreB family factor